MKSSERLVLALLAFVGLLIWIGSGILSGQKEAWDSPVFFIVIVPSMAALAFVIGFVRPGPPWLRGLALVILQPIAMVLMSDKQLGPLWMVGIFYFFLIAAACALASFLGTLSGRALRAKNSHSDVQ